MTEFFRFKSNAPARAGIDPAVRRGHGMFEFHISRKARDRYGFDDTLFSSTGNVVFTHFHGARVFARKMNDLRGPQALPEKTVHAGRINAMGLIDEILHHVVRLYRERVQSDIVGEALGRLEEKFGKERVRKTLVRFVEDFPTTALYLNPADPDVYLQGETDGIPNQEIVLEEIIALWLANLNPAFSSYNELFDDAGLVRDTEYRVLVEGLREFFDSKPFFGPDGQNLVDMLRSPAIASPHSLSGQLRYMLERWGVLLLDVFLRRLLGSLDFIREEEKIRFPHDPMHPEWGMTLGIRGGPEDKERFTADLDWMPRVVLIAKTIYVWLDQLSKVYGRSIGRLDQIPDEELDRLAGWGFTGLWLIGLWERSRASKTVKRLCGNPEAEASAYSLWDYVVAAQLGGEDALRSLKHRCAIRGIRMASDMVPNHTGIDSRWVIEHPDWFISQNHSPFPSYTFNGPNLSADPRVGIFLEDHYYNRTDAALVFKRVDLWTGDAVYIYHGNDGTSMPWNDTAQLDYLKPEVREAVIRTILYVSRFFSIIRFDAAMTLAKVHYQRLWFPEPGSGGDIPSRSDHGLTREAFDRLMPNEFWREVVDRINAENPDTLLLAEAFWLMEGYFVRTLGMHRVYNSAFMNMLKNEENAKYRKVIKDTIEYNPEILKRYVNFMNNPDEQTAVAQFGKDDKYFGVCVLLVTIPGLPMFGHGQIEGYTEKYGMEYRKAYWNETPDWDLVRRHEREIFPLLKRRHVFADVIHFHLYDFISTDGSTNENVFVHSNRTGAERALVVVNNKYQDARGWIRKSCPVPDRSQDPCRFTEHTPGEALGFANGEGRFCIFRDAITGMEFIRPIRDFFENGLYVELGAFKYHVFMDFYEVQDDPANPWARVESRLAGRGVPNVGDVLKEEFLGPVHQAFYRSLDPTRIRHTAECLQTGAEPDDPFFVDASVDLFLAFYRTLEAHSPGSGRFEGGTDQVRQAAQAVLSLPSFFPPRTAGNVPKEVRFWKDHVSEALGPAAVFLVWSLFKPLALSGSRPPKAQESGFDPFGRWFLDRPLGQALAEAGLGPGPAAEAGVLAGILVRFSDSVETALDEPGKSASGSKNRPSRKASGSGNFLRTLFEDPAAAAFLHINRHKGVLWFDRDAFIRLAFFLWAGSLLEAAVRIPGMKRDVLSKRMSKRFQKVGLWIGSAEKSGYQVENFLENAVAF